MERVPYPSRAEIAVTRIVGFTLVEMMVTLTLVAILLVVGIPSFQGVIATNRVSTLTNEFTTALQLARSEAITRGKRITVCKSSDSGNTSPSCSSTAAWQDGWIVFVDDDNQGQIDTDDSVLRVGQPSVENAEITAPSAFTSYVSFLQMGEVDGSGGTTSGTFNLCVAPQQRDLTISANGHTSIEEATCE